MRAWEKEKAVALAKEIAPEAAAEQEKALEDEKKASLPESQETNEQGQDVRFW